MSKLEYLSSYLDSLERKDKKEKLAGAITTLEILGYDAQFDMISNKYKVIKIEED